MAVREIVQRRIKHLFMATAIGAALPQMPSTFHFEISRLFVN